MTNRICGNVEYHGFVQGNKEGREGNFKMPTRSKEEIDDLFVVVSGRFIKQ